MYIKFKNGKEVTTLEPKRGLINVENKHEDYYYITIKKPIDIIRIDKDDKIILVFDKNIGDLTINHFIVGGKSYCELTKTPVNIDKLIINETSTINDIRNISVNELIIKESVDVYLQLNTVNVIKNYGKLMIHMDKNTIDRDRSYIPYDNTELFFDFIVNEKGKILFFLDENYDRLCYDIFDGENDNLKYGYNPENPYKFIKEVLTDFNKIKNYPKEKLSNFVDGEVIHEYLIEKYEKELSKTKEELNGLRQEFITLF
jgi:hypothetical protein